ncbi:PLP-dependent transferase [Basidiobolus meristosporus CBS 931.73]|uniref:serine C-palmitoyltransferase n=1 Tax=Basidiobolus meristosporus CBS 931.73 TaxID=1314790 RepID=A0A1Y1XYP2_9FUNG|nr:PLP-dependent transferase [Basidiobolus meristosporus CBS 931.73]|eukprot:ORX90870.1 PLP-dependent transferase [Basidiobolus meristosporus CBS 931.73]
MEVAPNSTAMPVTDLFSIFGSALYALYIHIPGSTIAVQYLRSSYQNDPFRVALELFLVFFTIRYLLAKKYRIDNSYVKLTKKEVEELVEEWQPEPLVPTLSEYDRTVLEKVPVIASPSGPRHTLAHGRIVLNLASFNFLGLMANEEITAEAIDALRKYGVGTCGPPGFYGTLDVHKLLEKDIANFLGVEDAIVYSQGFSTISSVIPAYSKRGDIIVCDAGVNFSIQKGVQISRSRVEYFKHNDMEDLERVLQTVQKELIKRPLSRRFIVVEGLYMNYGDIAPLDKLIELKNKYKYRLVLDESLSIGVLGKRGAGVTEHFGIPTEAIDFLVGSMCHVLTSSGGFSVGSREIIDHQRLSGLGYTYSASLPAVLAVSARKGLSLLQKDSSLIGTLRANISIFRKALLAIPTITLGEGHEYSPVIHIRIQSDLIDRLDLSVEHQEKILQHIVDDSAKNGVLLTRSMYVHCQEKSVPTPSIRLCPSAAHSLTESERAANTIKNIITKVIAKVK